MDRFATSYPTEEQSCFSLGAEAQCVDEELPFFVASSCFSVMGMQG